MGTVKVTNIEPIADNGTLTVGNSGDTIALTSGAKTSGFGKVGQVIQDIYSADAEVTTSTSYVDTSLSVTITPSSTSSKILILCTFLGQTSNDGYYDIKRGSTRLGGTTGFMRIETAADAFPVGINILDEPATTAATTYTLVMRVASSGNIILNTNGAAFKSTMQAMEILD